MDFSNVYEDAKRAEAYAKLEFPGTYYFGNQASCFRAFLASVIISQ